MKPRWLVCALLFSVGCSAFGQEATASKPPSVRVDGNVTPRHYTLDLTLVPGKADYPGKVDIDLAIKEPTSFFWMNGTDLNIEKAVLSSGGKVIPATLVKGDEDFIGFQLPSKIDAGNASLSLQFRGKIQRKSSAGIFENPFQGDTYLFTQFEPIDARRAFPCFDEPGIKTPWQLTLHIPANLKAFSNTNVEKEEPGTDGLKAVRFAETKPLPSYLIALAVGPLESVDAGVAGKNKVPVHIIVPKGTAPQAKYAAEVSAEILTRLENYFGIPFPYPKSDQLAVPLSFGGAMENPGLVTYDSSIILAPPDGDSPRRQRQYASIAAHELAHQWFGDYVTMAWWTDTWLNEGFATWMSAKLIADWKPEWNGLVDDQSARMKAMTEDSLVAARRINQPAESKSDIGNAFDAITYQKGGAVLGMFENFIGSDKFQRGVHNYLTKHAYGNARTEDFLAALGNVSDASIPEAFSTFLNQAGVPQIDVALRCENGKPPVLDLQQKRLLPLGSPGSADQTWRVPFCAAYSDGSSRQKNCTTLTGQTGQLQLTAKSCPVWVLPNAGELGYYRIKYPDAMLQQLIAHREELTLAERVGVLNDVRAAMKNGLTLPSQALSILPKLQGENNPLVLQAAVALVRSVPVSFLTGSSAADMQQYVETTFGQKARELGWQTKPSDDADTRSLRSSMVPFVALRGKDQELISSAIKLAGEWFTNHSVVGEEIASDLLSVALVGGDETLYNRILAFGQKEADANYKEVAFHALAGARSPEFVKRNFNLLLEGKIDPRYSLPFFFTPLSNETTKDLPFAFIKQNFDKVVSILPTGIGVAYAASLPRVGEAGCSEEERSEVESFFGPNIAKFTGGKRILAKTLEQIKVCAATKKAQQPDLTAFLSRYKGATSEKGTF